MMARSKGEGSVYKLPDGRWRGYVTVGYRPDCKLAWEPRDTCQSRRQAHSVSSVMDARARCRSGMSTTDLLPLGWNISPLIERR